MIFFLLIPEAAEQPYFKLPFQCGQTWDASTYAGHWPNGNSLDFILYDGNGGNISHGQPVWAAATGTVQFSGWWSDKSGWTVILDHGGGWKTYYLHLREQSNVAQGQEVKQGQHIGHVGNSGSEASTDASTDAMSDGREYIPHLHYTVMADDVAQRAVFSGQPAKPHDGDIAAKERIASRNCGSSWDGDARAELVIIEPDGTAKAFRNNGLNGLSTFAQTPEVIATGRDPARTYFADVDGNGRREIVDVPHADLNGDRRDEPTQGRYADLDGDGRDEPVSIEGRFADIDGNGRDELIKVAANGDVEAYWNNGNGFDQTPDIIASGITDPSRLFFA